MFILRLDLFSNHESLGWPTRQEDTARRKITPSQTSQHTACDWPKSAETSINPQLTLDVVRDPNKATRTVGHIQRFDKRLCFPPATNDSQYFLFLLMSPSRWILTTLGASDTIPLTRPQDKQPNSCSKANLPKWSVWQGRNGICIQEGRTEDGDLGSRQPYKIMVCFYSKFLYHGLASSSNHYFVLGYWEQPKSTLIHHRNWVP